MNGSTAKSGSGRTAFEESGWTFDWMQRQIWGWLVGNRVLRYYNANHQSSMIRTSRLYWFKWGVVTASERSMELGCSCSSWDEIGVTSCCRNAGSAFCIPIFFGTQTPSPAAKNRSKTDSTFRWIRREVPEAFSWTVFIAIEPAPDSALARLLKFVDLSEGKEKLKTWLHDLHTIKKVQRLFVIVKEEDDHWHCSLQLKQALLQKIASIWFEEAKGISWCLRDTKAHCQLTTKDSDHSLLSCAQS